MSYDFAFIPVAVPGETTFPVEAGAAEVLRREATVLDDPAAIRQRLLAVPGCRPGPGEAVDYLGAGMSYARLFVREREIHVENDCGARDLLGLYRGLLEACPTLLILDLQSGQLHDAASLEAWWSQPL